MAQPVVSFTTASIDTRSIGNVVDQMIGVARDSRKGFEKRWYDNNFFDDGYHFRYLNREQNKVIDLASHSTIWEPMRAIPKASRQIRGVANLLLSQDPTPIVYPDKITRSSFANTDEYNMAMKIVKDYAKKIGHWLGEEFKNQDLLEKLALMVILTCKHGVSFIQVWPDAVEEAIRTQVYDAFDIYLIGSLTEIYDSPFIIKASPQFISQIKANESFDPEQLKKISPDNRLASSEIKEAYMRARYGKETNVDQSATLMLKEAFIKEYLGDSNRERIRLQKNGGEILKAKKDGDPVIRQVFVAGNVWLRDEYTNLPDYPFVDFRMEPGPIYQVPLIERFIPANKSLDMAVSRLERFFHTMNVGIWTKRKGEDFTVTNQAGGQIIEYAGVPPTQGQISSPSAMSFPFLQMLENHIEEQGVSTTLGKLPRGVKGNAAIESLKETEYANLVIPVRRVRNTVKKIAEKMIDIVDNYFVTPQTVYYLEKGEPQYFDIIGNTALQKRKELGIDETPLDAVPVKKEYRVDIEVQSGMGFTREGQKIAAKELMDFLIQLSQIGLVSPEVVKLFVEQLLQTYKFGPTQDVMDAIDKFTSEGQTTDEQAEKIKIAVLEALKDAGEIGQEAQGNRIMENKIGVLEALKDSGLIDKLGKPNTEPTKEPSQSISFKDMPISGKVQLAAKAGIELNEDELSKQELDKVDLKASGG
jgi:hypothetical protein